MSNIDRLSWQPSARIASKVGKYLDHARIPNSLWGDLALYILGVPDPAHFTDLEPPSTPSTNITKNKQPKPQLIQFIIPDDARQNAVSTLLKYRFRACPAYSTCDDMRLQTPCPYVHYHITERGQSFILGLFSKLKLLWTLPEFTLRLPNLDDTHFIVTTDTRHPVNEFANGKPCGSGPWPDNLYPVKILTVSGMINALIWLLCRDLDQEKCRGVWLDALRVLAEYVVIIEDPVDLDPRFMAWWKEWYDGGFGDIYGLMVELRGKLSRQGELPASPTGKLW